MDPPAFREPANLSTTVADHLADLILSGALPPGERLVQTDLAARLGVSRVTIRDALKVLERRGLAVNIPRKGMVVRQVSEKAVRDLLDVQRALDILAIQAACLRITAGDIARLEAILREQEEALARGDEETADSKDWEFHQAIYLISGNEPLQEITTYLGPRTRQARTLGRMGYMSEELRSRKGSLPRHRRILAALCEGSEHLLDEALTEIMVEVEEGLLQRIVALAQQAERKPAHSPGEGG